MAKKRSVSGGSSKALVNPKAKITSAPPLSGRYSRSEGAGPGPKRKHANEPKKK